MRGAGAHVVRNPYFSISKGPLVIYKLNPFRSLEGGDEWA